MSERARSFGIVAEQYERYRPTYPMALYDDVVAYAGVGPGSRVLDVGTGKGVRPLAAQGLDVVGIEPDPAMAAVLAREVPLVRVVVGLFEDDLDLGGPFDLLTSAQAWHWNDPATHWQRAHELLRPGGAIALFWNHLVLHGVDADAVRAAYARTAPHIPSDVGGGSPETGDLVTSWPGDVMAGDLLLRDHEARLYEWTRVQSREDYLATLDTQSLYRVLPDADRAALFADLAAVLPERVEHAMVTVLHLARTR